MVTAEARGVSQPHDHSRDGPESADRGNHTACSSLVCSRSGTEPHRRMRLVLTLIAVPCARGGRYRRDNGGTVHQRESNPLSTLEPLLRAHRAGVGIEVCSEL